MKVKAVRKRAKEKEHRPLFPVLDRRRRGMVLVLVLVVVALLTLAAGSFAKLMLAERRAAVLSAQQAQARALADSGVEMARLFMVQEKQIQDEAGGWYNNPYWFSGIDNVVFDDGQGEDAGRFAIVSPGMNYGIAEGIRYGLEDESTRLNLNALISVEKAVPGAGREILMELPGMTEYIADAILDWIDEDEEIREFGAEAEYYSALESPYEPKNGPLQTVEELLLVRGVTGRLLFGCDADRNGFIDAGEPDSLNIENVDNSDGSMNRGWAAYLTLYSRELNLNPDGEPKIDLNQEDQDGNIKELYNQLKEALGQEWATFIVAYRLADGPYTGNQPAQPYSGGEPDLSQKPQRKLSTLLDLIGQNVEVRYAGSDSPTVLETPFPDEPGAMGTYLPKLMDYVAVVTTSPLPARININQASRTVLEGIPGMTVEVVDRIIAEREPDPTGQSYRSDETWILSEELVTLEEMKALIPFVTAGGNVYRAQVIGYFDRGGPAVRIEVIIDATTNPARVVCWRDMSHLGRGYALEILGVGTDLDTIY